MSLNRLQIAARAARRLVVRVLRHLGPNHASAVGHSAIDIRDPLAGALHDADLLVAFGTQSTRPIAMAKVAALVNAATDVRTARRTAAGPQAAQLTAFWEAYDTLNLEMTPLTAHSIRSSLDVNATRFPWSMATPLGVNAWAAVLVFLFCLALQVFWVSGKDIVERVEALEKERLELQQKIVANGGLLRRKETALKAKQCELRPEDCGQFVRTSIAPPRTPAADRQRPEPSVPELVALMKELNETRLLDEDMAAQMGKINERSKPLQPLLTRWHERVGTFCQWLGFLCPVHQDMTWDNQQVSMLRMIEDARAGVLVAQAELDGLRARAQPAAYSYADMQAMLAKRAQLELRQQEVDKLQRRLAELEDDKFRGMVTELRVVMNSIGVYFIPMVMGVLGALTYILRSASVQLREHTYVPMATSVNVIHVCLGAIAGVFGSMLVPNGDDAVLKSLPPLVVPFVFGYGIEIVFSLLDGTVGRFKQAKT